jgi:glycine dehydrogenase subunit 2
MIRPIQPKPAVRRFHQARWDEPILFELSQPGQRGVLIPPVEEGIQREAGDAPGRLPEPLRRGERPALPEMSQIHVLRHFARLSQENLGVDLNVDVGQGTCTMKYSPKGQRPTGSLAKDDRAAPSPG